MICEHKLTAQKNGDFFIEGEGERRTMESGGVLTIKCKHDTVRLTLIKEKANEIDGVKEKEQKQENGGEAAVCKNCAYFSLWPYDLGDDTKSSLCKNSGWRVSCSFPAYSKFKPITGGKATGRLSVVIDKAAKAAGDCEMATGDAKPESVKLCGNCRYTPEGIVNFSQIVLCKKRGRMVPASFDGCSYFESRTGESSASAANPTTERIFQLEKENSELQKTNEHLQEELIWQFEQLTKKIGTLQDQNDRLRVKCVMAIEGIKSGDGFLVDQLAQAVQRIKELEAELSERNQSLRPTRFFVI